MADLDVPHNSLWTEDALSAEQYKTEDDAYHQADRMLRRFPDVRVVEVVFSWEAKWVVDND